MSYSQLSYDIGWYWHNAWTMAHFRADPIVARKGNDVVYLENHYNCIFLTSTNRDRTIKFQNPCRTISELDDCKHELLNKGWKVNWISYQLILEIYNEHFKVYAPYIK